jgi:hypothetical protein
MPVPRVLGFKAATTPLTYCRLIRLNPLPTAHTRLPKMDRCFCSAFSTTFARQLLNSELVPTSACAFQYSILQTPDLGVSVSDRAVAFRRSPCDE